MPYMKIVEMDSNMALCMADGLRVVSVNTYAEKTATILVSLTAPRPILSKVDGHTIYVYHDGTPIGWLQNLGLADNNVNGSKSVATSSKKKK